MRTIKYTNKFKRDYKREKKSGRYRSVLEKDLSTIINALANDHKLPPHSRDHALSNNWKDFRDCHLKPDLILIYQKPDDNSLVLVRLGSHSELGL
jgi:mRNA interferase YafQ